jgi:protein-disulfide isomerase
VTTESKHRTTFIIVTATVVAVVAGLAVVVALTSRNSGADATEKDPFTMSTPANPSAQGPTPMVRDNSHVLGPPGDGKVTMVEFLDFECEACRALYPFYEELRKEYAGKVRFVARYFPIPSHFNAMNAAIAVEAAAQQGYFEPMYKIMYETQEQWGEQQVSKADLFRGWAQQLGLDLAKYDAAVADPATAARITQDQQDGEALGVEGTPTLFLNGKKLELSNGQQLMDEINAAIAAS